MITDKQIYMFRAVRGTLAGLFIPVCLQLLLWNESGLLVHGNTVYSILISTTLRFAESFVLVEVDIC